MKKFSIFLMLAMFLVGTAVTASAFTLAGGYSGPFKMKFSNWDNLILPTPNLPGPPPSYFDNNGDGIEDNYGIIFITEIRSDDGMNTLLWSDGTTGETLTGMFYGLDTQSWVPDGLGGISAQAVGGKMDIYLDTSPGSFDATLGVGGYTVPHTEYTGINTPADLAAGASLFLSLDFVPGIDTANDATLDSSLDSSTAPITGDASFYLGVTGGAYADMFDTNGFTPTYTPDGGMATVGSADLFAQNDFVPNDGSTAPIQGDWGLLSEDPVRGIAAPIPEPSTMMLFGLGLLGLGFVGRKKLTEKD